MPVPTAGWQPLYQSSWSLASNRLFSYQLFRIHNVNLLHRQKKSIAANAANKYFTNIVTDVTHNEASQDIMIGNDSMQHELMQMFKGMDQGFGEICQQL